MAKPHNRHCHHPFELACGEVHSASVCAIAALAQPEEVAPVVAWARKTRIACLIPSSIASG